MKAEKLSHFLRPQFDLFTGGQFRGSHNDLVVIHKRDGNTITESVAWVKGFGGHFANRRTQTFFVSDIIADCARHGIAVEDDVPHGRSVL